MKYPKLLSLALAAALSVSTCVPAGAYALISGDVNNDGAITSDDLALIQGYVLGKNELSKEQAAAADINGDKTVNSSDIAKVRKTILETTRELSYKSVVDRVSSGYTDALKKIDNSKSEITVTSTAELKSALSPYLSETLVNSYLQKYNDSFFKESMLLIKPFYYDPAKYSKNGTHTKLSCGCSNAYAGIYKPSAAVTLYMNLRKEHSFQSESIGKVYPGTEVTITYANGNQMDNVGHATVNGVSGYLNMGYLTKVADLAPTYTSIPDIQISSVKYDKSKITITAKETAAAANVGFSAAIIAQTVLPKKEYYASSVTWSVNTTTTTTTTTTSTTTTTTTTCKYPLAKARMDQMGIKTLQEAFYDCYKKPERITSYVEWEKDASKITLASAAEYGFKNRKGNCYVLAAMFCEMAQLLGYDAHLISGKVPLAAAHGGGYGPHGWVEIPENRTNYIYDPDYALETGKNGYKLVYGNTAWSYIKLGEIK